MDSFEGAQLNPITLHKFLYANSDPVNNIDPSGNNTLVEQLDVVATIGILASLAYRVQSSLKIGIRNRLQESFCLQGGGIPLYRTMKITPLGLPKIEPSASGLGVRVSGSNPDVEPDEEGELEFFNRKKRRLEGMSVTPFDPKYLPPHRKPRALGGTSKYSLFCLNSNILAQFPALSFAIDKNKPEKGEVHGLIGPAGRMHIDTFQYLLGATQPFWLLVLPGDDFGGIPAPSEDDEP